MSDYALGIKLSNGQMCFVDAVDPASSGLARYINHSAKRPNVKRKTVLSGPDGGKPRVLMYARRTISAGEELLWDYGQGYVDSHAGMVEDEDENQLSVHCSR